MAALALARAGARRLDIGKLLIVVVLLLVGLGVVAGQSELKFRELSKVVETHVSTYQRQRWERPVLRGVAIDENAGGAARKALEGLEPLDKKTREALAEAVHYGSPLPEAIASLVKEQAPRIAALRAATQGSFSVSTIDPVALERPSYPVFVDAMLLVLADSMGMPADACLPAALDALRLAQDQVPGAPLESVSVAMRVTSIATPVITRCARGASSVALLAAARELHNLATHPPPSFGGIELADVQMLLRLRALGTVWPLPKGESAFARIKRRPAVLAATKHFDKPTRWRALRANDYPDALQAWLDEQDWRERADLPMISDSTEDVSGWLFDDMRGQALLRILTVGLATLAERENRGRMPREPLNLGDPALRDPFNGRPLGFRMAQDSGELTLWSVGEDRRDDKGSSDWTKQAPIDVTVHFPLGALVAEPAKARAR